MTTTEVQFCERLRAWGEGLGFLVYPEVQGWDLVFVSGVDRDLGDKSGLIVRGGLQFGIHAKLRPSFEVLEQAAAGGDFEGVGPAYRFVAVQSASVGAAFLSIARRLRIGVIGETATPIVLASRMGPEDREPLPLPPIAARGIAAGAPCPRVLSPWRVKALRFLAFARAKGGEGLTIRDLKAHGLNKDWADAWMVPMGWEYAANDQPQHRTWSQIQRARARGEELEHRAGGRAVVKVRTYRLRPEPEKLPDFGYEAVYAELAAKDAA